MTILADVLMATVFSLPPEAKEKLAMMLLVNAGSSMKGAALMTLAEMDRHEISVYDRRAVGDHPLIPCTVIVVRGSMGNDRHLDVIALARSKCDEVCPVPIPEPESPLSTPSGQAQVKSGNP